MANPRHFLSCDWGTSSFRLRLVRRADLAVVEERLTGQGAAAVAEAGGPGAFADYLREQVQCVYPDAGLDPAACPVVISGMVGSSIGWHELPYARTPFPLDGSGARTHTLELHLDEGQRTSVMLVSGVRTESDVMRGEESEIIGLFAGEEFARFADRCTLVLPGTHSKHVRIGGGKMTGFRTFMTGEVFAVLRRHSILRHSTEELPGAAAPQGEERDAFAEGVRRGGQGDLLGALFRVRTRELLDALPAKSNTWFLSGVLVGAELASLRDGSGPVLVCAGERFRDVYGPALEELHLEREHLVAASGLVENAIVRGHARLLNTFAV